MAERLGDAAESLAADRHDRLAVVFLRLLTFDTASMSSPMRPIGHSDWTVMPRLSGNSSWISSMILASFLSPPKTMSFSWKSEVNCMVTKVSMPVVPM